ncbi:MAG: TA system VapC family ribonuclease toxin [Burkholderiales bacterium]
MTPDVNVLVAAFREEHPHHFVARAWLSEALAECGRGGTLEVLPMVAAGFVRVATSPKAFPVRIASRAAFAFIRSILAVPGVSMPSLASEWTAFEKLCVDLELSGADVSDGWIAAAVKANGLRLVTFDADFDRLLEPSECLRLQPRPGVQARRGSYVLRRRSPRRAVATG